MLLRSATVTRALTRMRSMRRPQRWEQANGSSLSLASIQLQPEPMLKRNESVFKRSKSILKRSKSEAHLKRRPYTADPSFHHMPPPPPYTPEPISLTALPPLPPRPVPKRAKSKSAQVVTFLFPSNATPSAASYML